MANSGKMKAWYAAGGVHVYWAITQTADPLSEYVESPPEYPLLSDLSDFVLLFFNALPDNDEIAATWNFDVDEAGYAVGITPDSGPFTMGKISARKLPYSGSVAVKSSPFYGEGGINYVNGISTTQDIIKVDGVCSVLCDSTTSRGTKMYISMYNDGMVSNVMPITSGYFILLVGTSLTEKADPTPALIDIIFNPEEPIYLEDDLFPSRPS